MHNPLPLEKRIIYEDNHIIVVNKLPSEIVQQDLTKDVSLLEQLKAFIKHRDKKQGNAFVEVLHRIDRPVSGLIMFAKTSKALTKFNELIRNNEIKKTYLAVVKNKPPQNEELLEHYILRNVKTNKSKALSKPTEGAKKAILKYTVRAMSDKYYLLEIDLKTGRHHQIRAQLSAINTPIKGDIKYGYERTNDGGFIHLHAYRLQFLHPIKKEDVSICCNPAFKDTLWGFFLEKEI